MDYTSVYHLVKDVSILKILNVVILIIIIYRLLRPNTKKHMGAIECQCELCQFMKTCEPRNTLGANSVRMGKDAYPYKVTIGCLTDRSIPIATGTTLRGVYSSLGDEIINKEKYENEARNMVGVQEELHREIVTRQKGKAK